MRVRVWRNLRYDCWTVYCVTTRRVIGNEERVLLKDCTFHVSKKGRKRSLKKRWDSRHAYTEGMLASVEEMKTQTDRQCFWLAYDAKSGTFRAPSIKDYRVESSEYALFPESEGFIISVGGA